MKRWIGISFFCFILLISFAPQSDALSCVYVFPDKDFLMESEYRYDGVIVATVTNVKQTPLRREIKVDVLESYKGIEVSHINFYEDITWGHSQVGETYLFALRLENNKWTLPVCSSVHSSFEEFNTRLQELSDYPKIELKDSTSFNFNNTYLVAILIVFVAIATLVSIYFIKQGHKP